jgi:uncharacterized protein (TIGR03905 family)
MSENSAEKRYIYKTRGVCPAEIHFRIDGDVLVDLRFVGGGCPGNSTLVSRLLNGRPLDEIPAVLRGIECRDGTSCPDQLARALTAVENETLAPADAFRIRKDSRAIQRAALIGEASGDHRALEQVLAAAETAAPDAVFCAGNITGDAPRNKEVIRMLDKQGVQCVQGEADWRFAEGTEPPGWPKMDPIQRDRLMRLPQMLRFGLAGKTAVLFYGDFIQRLDGYSDYDPHALEMNMICGLADFMRDESVFPALEAMTPQFAADVVFFGQTRRWKHWRVGGKDIIGVGPTRAEGTLRWGLVDCRNGAVRLQTMTCK